MDTLSYYRQQIQQLLQEYSQYVPTYGQYEMEQVIDSVHDHYELLTVGWDANERVHDCIVHLDIKDGKIWIQHDGTEEGIATRLVASGIPKEDIVLAFHSPYKRQFTGFATG